MTIRNGMIDKLPAGQDPASVMRQDGLLGELKKALLNRLMAAEFKPHLTEDRATAGTTATAPPASGSRPTTATSKSPSRRPRGAS
jgi:hypothetical protein